MSRHGFVRLN